MNPRAGSPATTIADLSERLIDLEKIVLAQHGRIARIESRAREAARQLPPRPPTPHRALARTKKKKDAKEKKG